MIADKNSSKWFSSKTRSLLYALKYIGYGRHSVGECVDDVTLATTFEEIESTLYTESHVVQEYSQKWLLTLNPDKSIVVTFLLSNRKPIVEDKKIITEEVLEYSGGRGLNCVF